MNLEKNELLSIRGGASTFISGTILSGMIRGVQFVYQVGQALGTSISRLFKKNYC